MSRHTYDTDIDIAGLTVAVEITFDFERGYAGDRIDPPYQPSAEIISATFTWLDVKHEAPTWLLTILCTSIDLHDELVGYAVSECLPDPDAARDAAIEERLP